MTEHANTNESYRNQQLSAGSLRQLISLDVKTGNMKWKKRELKWFSSAAAQRAWNTRFAGEEAFTTNLQGYLRARIGPKQYLAHRVVWAIVYGRWPSDQIDHINGNRSDNSPENLREVNNSENQKNAKMQKNNTSGHLGVYWCSFTGKWRATIMIDQKLKCLGRYDSKQKAVSMRKSANLEYGFHENHGRK